MQLLEQLKNAGEKRLLIRLVTVVRLFFYKILTNSRKRLVYPTVLGCIIFGLGAKAWGQDETLKPSLNSQPSNTFLWNRIENEWPLAMPEYNVETYRLERLRMLGPLYEETFASNPKMKTFRPLFLEYWDKEKSQKSAYLLYPVFSSICTPRSKRWSFFLIMRSRTITYPSGKTVTDGMFIPFYFMRETGDPQTSYRAVFPLAGKIYNFFGNDEIRWYMWPIWAYTRKRDEEHFSFPWPFIRWQQGPKSGGWAFWPLTGHFYKKGAYDHAYRLWPLLYCYKDELWKDIPRIRRGVLPIYAIETSDRVRDVTFLWPFMGYRDTIRPIYHERRFIWPLWVQARGEKKYINRWAPFFAHSVNHGLDKKWFFWPFIKAQRWERKGLHFEQAQFLYFLIWHQNQRNIKDPNGPVAEKTHVWPLYSYWDNGTGKIQFQMLSPLEVFFQHNQAVRDSYSPLFAIYRFDQQSPGVINESLLFNLVTERRDTKGRQFTLGPLVDYRSEPGNAHFELLKGFFGCRKENGKRTFRFLWMKF